MKLIVYTFLAFLTCHLTIAQTNVTIDTSTHYQTIKAWEAMGWMANWDNQFQIDHLQDWNTIIADGAAEIGINRVRIEVNSGSENPIDYFTQYITGQITRSQWKPHWYDCINDNNDPAFKNNSGFHFSKTIYDIENVALPLKNAVEALGKSFYLNLCYVHFAHNDIPHDDDAAEYAEFILAAFDTLQSHFGFVPNGLELVLEPENSSFGHGGTTVIGNRIRDAIKAVGDTLSVHGYQPDIIASSPTNAGHAVPWINATLNDPIAKNYLTEISYHKYGGRTDANLSAICNIATTHNKISSMIEWWAPNNDQHGIYQDLTSGCVSVWQSGILGEVNINNFNPQNTALFNIDDTDPNNPVVTEGPKVKYFRQYLKYIPIGALRIGATITNTHQVTAFKDTTDLLTVIINADNQETFNIDGLSTGNYGISYSTYYENHTILPDITIGDQEQLTTSIPHGGVITIFQKPTVLAVDHVILHGDYDNNRVVLRWKIDPNKVISHFEIQRSIDKTDWNLIGNLPKNGSNTSYQFIDSNPSQGGIYYRIKVVDNNNNYTYSDQLEIMVDPSLITITPNPSSGIIRINTNDLPPNDHELWIINNLGQTVIHDRFIHKDTPYWEYHIEQKGLYTVILNNGTKTISTKISIQ